MIYGSVCSGIEAASVAWHPLGWRAAFLSEIEAFPRAVLAHRWPDVKCHGDFTTIKAGEYEPIDALVGGTPCQSFSIAGLRGGMADERGNLALEYLRLADRLRPVWLVWENVPGVLSSNGGRDFGSFLGGLGQLGYGFAYRVLDAQYFGLAQRRQRVFVVGYLGDWRRAAAVLFEPASLRGHPAPRREAGKGVADRAECGAAVSSGSGWWDSSDVGATIRADGSVTKADTLIANTLRVPSHGATWRADGSDNLIARPLTANRAGGSGGHRYDAETETLLPVAHALRVEGFDASEDGTGRGTPLVPTTAYAIQERAVCENPNAGPDGAGFRADVSYTLEARTVPQSVACAAAVRRLTPMECERLQGFPDNYTNVSYRGRPAADGPRYRALGNSMAVPVMSWIGRRIAAEQARINSSQEKAA